MKTQKLAAARSSLAPKAKRRITSLKIASVDWVDQPAVPTPGSTSNVLLTKARGGSITKLFRVVSKSNEPEQRFVLASALVPDVADLQGDIMSPDVIREAAWDYLENSRKFGWQHKSTLGSDQASLVESYIAPVDMTIGSTHVAKGTWLIGARLSPDIFKKVKSGGLLGVSIGGHASSEPTQKSDDNGSVFKHLYAAALKGL